MNIDDYFKELEEEHGRLTFGEFLKSRRLSEDLTQKEFSKMLHLSVQNLCDLEKGRRIPSPTRAARIAKKLKLPESGLIQLALRDSLREQGFKYEVKLESA
jgi:transcriptional regulator with XRE-family HTH domain